MGGRGRKVIIYDDGLLFNEINMTVIHVAGHWQFFKFNNRRCEQQPLTKGSTTMANADLASNVTKPH